MVEVARNAVQLAGSCTNDRAGSSNNRASDAANGAASIPWLLRRCNCLRIVGNGGETKCEDREEGNEIHGLHGVQDFEMLIVDGSIEKLEKHFKKLGR